MKNNPGWHSLSTDSPVEPVVFNASPSLTVEKLIFVYETDTDEKKPFLHKNQRMADGCKGTVSK